MSLEAHQRLDAIKNFNDKQAISFRYATVRRRAPVHGGPAVFFLLASIVMLSRRSRNGAIHMPLLARLASQLTLYKNTVIYGVFPRPP